MLKRIMCLFLSVLLVLVLPVTSFAAGGGFNQGEYAKLKTYEEKTAYLLEVDKYYESKGFSGIDPDEFAAYTAARSELREGVAPKTTTDDTKTIANIAKTYGVVFEVGNVSGGSKNVKITQHLTNIDKGLAYLGGTFVKKIARTYEATQGAKTQAAEWGANAGKFTLYLSASEDVYDRFGKMTTSSGVYGTGGVKFYGFNSSPVGVRTTVHEFGHALCDAAHGSIYADFGLFANRDGITYAESAVGGAAISKYDTNRYVTAYAASSAKEDYAETFTVAVMGGSDKPYTGSKNSVIYQKTKVIYDDLVKFAGADSRATQRVGGYLGL